MKLRNAAVLGIKIFCLRGLAFKCDLLASGEIYGRGTGAVASGRFHQLRIERLRLDMVIIGHRPCASVLESNAENPGLRLQSGC